MNTLLKRRRGEFVAHRRSGFYCVSIIALDRIITRRVYTISPYGIVKPMTHIDREKQKLVARIKRIRGQVDSIERSLTTGDDCADVLMLLANVRGGINSLMAEVLEDHIRLHMMGHEKSAIPSAELAEDLIGLVRAYLK